MPFLVPIVLGGAGWWGHSWGVVQRTWKAAKQSGDANDMPSGGWVTKQRSKPYKKSYITLWILNSNACCTFATCSDALFKVWSVDQDNALLPGSVSFLSFERYWSTTTHLTMVEGVSVKRITVKLYSLLLTRHDSVLALSCTKRSHRHTWDPIWVSNWVSDSVYMPRRRPQSLAEVHKTDYSILQS